MIWRPCVRPLRRMRPPVLLTVLGVAAIMVLSTGAHAERAPCRSGTRVRMIPDSSIIMVGDRDYLEPNVPNPFGSDGASISYSLSKESHVVLKVYDFFYRELITIVDEDQGIGRHTAFFKPSGSISSGMYFYELRAGDFYAIRRMTYVR